MRSPSNPYNWRRINLNVFYGRTELVANLSEKLISGKSFGIVGGYGIGKTTFLRRVEQELLARARGAKSGGLLVVPIYIDTLAIASTPSISLSESIYQEIAYRVNEKLIQVPESPEVSYEHVDAVNFRNYLQNVVDAISASDYRPQIIFLFDEVEPIVSSGWGRGFLRNWRSLLSNTPELGKYLSAIFSGENEIFEIAGNANSELIYVLDLIELKLFSQNETAKLMCQPSRYCWSDSLITEVHRTTGGHPLLIQYVMQIICNHDVEDASRSLEEAKAQFLSNPKIVFQNWLERFDDKTCAIYRYLTQVKVAQKKALITEFGIEANRKLSLLAYTGVIGLDQDSGIVRIEGSLFQEWFNEFGSAEAKPTPNQIVHLIRKLEPQFQEFLAQYFDSKDLYWLKKYYSNQERHQERDKWNNIIKRTQKAEGEDLTNIEVLEQLYLSDLFNLVLLKSEWESLSGKFTKLSSDRNQIKSRFTEYRDHLVKTRNCVFHSKDKELTDKDLEKAQEFCLDLLECFADKKFELAVEAANNQSEVVIKSNVERSQVFISYSHRDRDWLEKLQVMLGPLARKRKIELWDDTRIRVGAKWREEIEKALTAAKVAVLLVSPNFLNSKFIDEHELPSLLNAASHEGLTIIWILVSACLYEDTAIEMFQAAHNVENPLDSLSPSQQNQVLTEIGREIKRIAQA